MFGRFRTDTDNIENIYKMSQLKIWHGMFTRFKRNIHISSCLKKKFNQWRTRSRDRSLHKILSLLIISPGHATSTNDFKINFNVKNIVWTLATSHAYKGVRYAAQVYSSVSIRISLAVKHVFKFERDSPINIKLISCSDIWPPVRTN